MYGRKWNSFFSFVVFIAATIGLMISHDINILYFLLFVIGVTFAGRAIVNYNYLIEIIESKYKELIIFIRLLFQALFIILITVLV